MNVHSIRRIECVVESCDHLGETPLWCNNTKRLWWIDIENPALQSYDPETGAHQRMKMPGAFLGSHSLAKFHQHLLAIDLTVWMANLGSGAMEPFTMVERDVDTRLNDGRVDQRGRLWIGSMDNGLKSPAGGLYRVDPDRAVTRFESDVIVANGIAFSPDGKTFYFTDTRRYMSFAYDFDLDDGVISNRRIFADYSSTGERPDGACVDTDGCLWTAFFAGARIARYRPDGRIDLTIKMPITNPTCVAFGGHDLKTLFITSARKFLTAAELAAEPLAGSLFAIEGAGQGLTEHRFG